MKGWGWNTSHCQQHYLPLNRDIMLNISLGISNISFKVIDNSYETKFMFPRPAVPFRVEIEFMGNVG